MIKAKHHNFIYPFFKWLTKVLIKKNFEKVNFIGDFEDQHQAVLVIANHVSWWDGFWILNFNMKNTHRKFHFMMLEDQLRKHWYFNYSGGFSIKKGSRSILESIAYTKQLLTSPDNFVLMFPQGEIQSMHHHDLKFEAGINRIMKSEEKTFQVLFLANFTDYLSKAKPELYTYFQEFKDSNNSLESAYREFYNNALKQQQNLKS